MNYIGVKAADIGVAPDGAIQIKDGDFELTESYPVLIDTKYYLFNQCDRRCIFDTIVSSVGIWRRTPALGVDIYSFLNGPLTPNQSALLASKIRENIQLGKYFEVLSLKLTDPIEIQTKRLKV